MWLTEHSCIYIEIDVPTSNCRNNELLLNTNAAWFYLATDKFAYYQPKIICYNLYKQ